MVLAPVVLASAAEPVRTWDHSFAPGNANIAGEVLTTLPCQFHEKEKRTFFENQRHLQQLNNKEGDSVPPAGGCGKLGQASAGTGPLFLARKM